MSENVYGFEDDKTQSGGGLIFGLNSGVTRLVKFEFNPNGGKDDAEQEALDVVFNVDGRDVSYRMFPVTRAYDDNAEITDPRHPAMQKAIKEFNSIIVHILHAFVPKEAIKTALSIPIASFKQFCTTAQTILPKDFSNKPLDIFAQWQWSISGDNERTWLRLPKNMKHGKWICAHIPPLGGQWNEIRLNGGLKYKSTDPETKKMITHPFDRSKWFMDSNFAEMQSDAVLDDISTDSHAATGEETSQNWS